MRDGSWKCTQGTAGRVPACCLLLAPYLSESSTMVKSACCLLLSACTISLQKLACCSLVHHISSTPRLWSSWALSRWPDAPDGKAMGWCTRLSWLLCYISWCCFPGASRAIGVARPSLLVLFSDIVPVVVLTNLARKQDRTDVTTYKPLLYGQICVTNIYVVQICILRWDTWYKFVPCGQIHGTKAYLGEEWSGHACACAWPQVRFGRRLDYLSHECVPRPLPASNILHYLLKLCMDYTHSYTFGWTTSKRKEN